MRRVRRAWYYLRSFFRKNWSLADYPVVIGDQRTPEGEGSTARDDRARTRPAFAAWIDGMFLIGGGDTPEAARQKLAQNFEEFRAANVLPRPGTQQPIVFGPTERIAGHGMLRDEFLERVLHMGANIFVSDGSTLSDFPEARADYDRRIILLYGIDVDQLADDRLVTILDAIARR